jgi:hypothetical protein
MGSFTMRYQMKIGNPVNLARKPKLNLNARQARSHALREVS